MISLFILTLFSISSCVPPRWTHVTTEAPFSKDPRGMNFAEFVAYGVCEDNIAYSCFEDADANHDGFVSENELAEYRRLGMERANDLYDQYLRSSFEKADKNRDGYVDYDEATDFAQEYLKVKTDAVWQDFFYNLAGDNGMLDKQQFYQLMNTYYRGDLQFDDYTPTSSEEEQDGETQPAKQ